MARWRPKIEHQVHQILDGLESQSQIDIIRDLAYPLPVRIISTLLGVPDEQLDRCVELSNVIAIWFANVHRSTDSARPAQAAIQELAGYFNAIIARRRAEDQSDDLLDFLLQIVDANPTLSDEDLLAQCVMLLFAGHETTRHWIGNSVYTFLEQPGLLDALCKDPALVRPAMEEVLRFQGPVQMFGRTVLREIAIDGAHIEPGDSLLLVVAAANRDPNQFEEPNRFNPRRTHIRHFAFGGDAHVCLGSTLARLEGVITVTELVRRFPRMHLKQPAPDWGSMIAFRGLNTLQIGK
jgi:cytochrome P450